MGKWAHWYVANRSRNWYNFLDGDLAISVKMLNVYTGDLAFSHLDFILLVNF